MLIIADLRTPLDVVKTRCGVLAAMRAISAPARVNRSTQASHFIYKTN
jgi:hypothetical protein